jgi:hypothetical protein
MSSENGEKEYVPDLKNVDSESIPPPEKVK